MDLELRHLRCLVAIVDSGTFTDAAIELGTSQAAVSRNLMALEQVLGVRLLHRTSRTITPTTAGVHVLAQARQVLAAAGNLVAEATTGSGRRATSTTGSRSSPPAAASGSLRRGPRPSTGGRASSSGQCETPRRSPST
jgi:DNA-binding transcriptional LysR family regulator